MHSSHHDFERAYNRLRHHFAGRFGRHRFRHGWGGESDEGRGRRRVFDSGELRLVLLKLIGDQPRHGYDLIRAIEELSGGVYVPSPGVVYPTLTMLSDMGHIEEAKSEGARKAFAITADGTAHLAEKKAEVDALFARLAELASLRQRTDAAPVRRALANLRAVLMNRLERDDVRPETVHTVAGILDEAAQKIERL
ncbi:MAG: PadR family transcriptional regulator [Alphaproteobacteria bacterium]|nr:PadR family transcriptional regulator [Alphaproteobacteria bacterium]MBV8409173.1 PadR family transcriptional regulator [Alphaproteobacteria bacterium]